MSETESSLKRWSGEPTEHITFEQCCDEAATLLHAADITPDMSDKLRLSRHAERWMDLACIIQFGERRSAALRAEATPLGEMKGGVDDGVHRS
jgi:hypothetical protein